MTDQCVPEEFTLTGASKNFIAITATESGEHIRPLHRYLGIRLVVEGGFLPEEIAPTPPLKSEFQGGAWYLRFDPTAENKKEQIVLGALKSKRIDIVAAKEGIGPVLAVSVKGTSKAFRNLVNRTEEAIGDCANIHIMYPGLVYGFVHFLRATGTTDLTLKPNDILLGKDGDVLPSVRDYARILEGLAGRMLVRNDYSRYESVALAVLKSDAVEGELPLLRDFPVPGSPLSLDSFFATLYRVYDLRFSYTYTDPGVKHLKRVVWHRDSPVISSLCDKNAARSQTDYSPRVSGE
ncbi:hypothetical protein JW916_07580 [Candidatus Sumerlaeota bacterium]|nr:hypothetical protein [Candidatus Sumerlaeota bacterium]